MSKKPILSEADKQRLLSQKEIVHKRKREIIEGLPHLYGFKHYTWSRKFFESHNKMNLLCAGNQLSKSSTQIRKCIEWATNPKLWKVLWPGRTPRIFWYFYPSIDVAKVEVEKKWVPEFLPRGRYKDDMVRGWHLDSTKREINAIHFNSGISVYFKYYSQEAINLQSSTVDAIFCFPAETLIKTRFGAKFICDIRVGDHVLTPNGVRRVVKVYPPRISSVCSRLFSDGSMVTATAGHPFYVSNGAKYVPFSELTPEHSCVKLSAWLALRSVYLLTALFTHVILRVRTCVRVVISEVLTEKCCTLLFGKIFTVRSFLKILSFIIETIIPLIMIFPILSVCLVLRIPNYIKSMNGNLPRLKKVYVRDVVNLTSQEVQEKLFFVPFPAAVLKLIKPVKYVIGHIKLGWIGLQNYLVGHVLQKKDSLVYNFQVEEDHIYFADGFLVHNCDEEIPVDYYNELLARTFASDGYFHMVFTATLGQELWQRAIEGVGDKEMFKDAFKLQVSMYDCQFYEDGSPGAYDLEKIKRVEEKCTSEAEIQKRVHGKFIADSGRKYYAYSASRHYMKKFPIPADWKLYGGADIGSGGSGGKDAHPGAICFVAVRPDYQFGVVYKAWRGDSEATTAGDILNRFIELRDQDQLTLQIFDQNAKDFGTIAGRIGESFCKAEKSHEIGEQVVNTLFKNDMIMLFDEDPEIAKLGSELQSLQKSTPKNRAKDDLADAFRYAVVKIPWDFSIAKSEVEIKAPALPLYDRPVSELSSDELRELEIMERRGLVPRASGHSKDTWEETEEEFDFWNESYGN